MINFPTSLDTLTNPNAGDNTSVVSHSLQHQNVNDAIEALEAKVGVNSSAVTSSHDYKLSEVAGSDKAVSKTGTQTLTNKTLTSPTINGGTLDSATITSPTVTVGSDAVGDIYTRDTGGALARIGAGTTGQVLTSNGAGTKPTYQTPSTITKAEVQNQSVIYATAGGTANALTLTLSPAPSAYTAGMKVSFKASASNTGATTINVNGLGVKDIRKDIDKALVGGEIVNGGIYELSYDGTNFQATTVQTSFMGYPTVGKIYTNTTQSTNGSSTVVTIYSGTLVANTLTTNRAIKGEVLIYAGNSVSGSSSVDFKIGGTTIFQTFGQASSVFNSYRIKYTIAYNSSTSVSFSMDKIQSVSNPTPGTENVASQISTNYSTSVTVPALTSDRTFLIEIPVSSVGTFTHVHSYAELV